MKLKNIQFSVIAVLLMGVSFIGRAQTTSQKFGENPTVKNEGAVLELESTNKGVILPRVSIANTTTWGLAGTATRGMAIYNINTAVTGTTTYPVASGDGTGLYFWDGTGWAATAKASAAADVTKDAWVDDAANTQVKLGTKSDGTTVRSAGTEIVIKDDGKVGIGTNSPIWQLDVQGADAIGHFKRFTGNSAFNVAPAVLLSRSRGTATSEANVQGGDFLGKIQFRGFSNTNTPQDADFGTFAYIANSTTKGDGRFAFLKEEGRNSDIIPEVEVMSISTKSGNVGIGEATPSAKLEVNGNVEIQMVDNVQNDISYKPLVWNTNTKRVETTDDNAAVRRSVTVASGATATVGTPLIATSGGAGYEIKLLVNNGCGVSVFSKFIASGSTSGYWRINFIAGISQNGPASGASTGNGSTVTVTNPLSSGCADGGNSTALNYTISISNSGQVSVTNNGNISKTYILILEKVIE
jgi:hypothetical protein